MPGSAVIEVPEEARALTPVGGTLGFEEHDQNHRGDRFFDSAQTELAPAERVCQLGAAGRLAAFEVGEFGLHELTIWAARFPEEVPLINGEFPWIALTLADLD